MTAIAIATSSVDSINALVNGIPYLNLGIKISLGIFGGFVVLKYVFTVLDQKK